MRADWTHCHDHIWVLMFVDVWQDWFCQVDLYILMELSLLFFFSQASLLLKWASCRRPAQKSPWARGRHWFVWPARAFRQTGSWAGRWKATSGLRRAVLGWCRRTLCTAGAAAWLSLRTSGWRREALWAVRPHAAASLQSVHSWPEISAHSELLARSSASGLRWWYL